MAKKHPHKKPSLFSGFLTSLILFSIAAIILNFLATIIPFLIIAAIIVGVLYIISKSSGGQEQISGHGTDNLNPTVPTGLQHESIKRQVEILTESIQLVNDSNNLDTVLRRYSLVCDTLEKLSEYTDYDIRNAGYHLKEPLSDTRRFMRDNKSTIINQAIERYIKYETSKLTTATGKNKKINSLYEKIRSNSVLEKDNIVFLEGLCHSMKKDLLHVSAPITQTAASVHTPMPEAKQETDISSLSNLPVTIDLGSECMPKIYPEIIDLLWIGDGKYKNYSPSAQQTAPYNSCTINFSPNNFEEPSTLYLSLPVSRPQENALVERPPYYPSYKELSPEQRWLYWEFLADPFSPRHNIGYVFLFYYGLERHMASGKLDNAFDVVLELRKVYSTSSFQSYTANALTLICIAKQRADLALKLIKAAGNDTETSIQAEYLLILKYAFQIPLTVSEIIRNHKYFEFHNDRYIKGQPDLFRQAFSEFLQRDFHADSIDLAKHFPLDIGKLPAKQKKIFANVSLASYETPVPDFKNRELIQAVSALLLETHEAVKSKLRELRKRDRL